MSEWEPESKKSNDRTSLPDQYATLISYTVRCAIALTRQDFITSSGLNSGASSLTRQLDGYGASCFVRVLRIIVVLSDG
jgi:hypothetical protein